MAEDKHLVQRHPQYSGELSRNTSYREDARGHVRGIPNYDDADQIIDGVMRQKSIQALEGQAAGGALTQQAVAAEIASKVQKYLFDYLNRDRIPPYRNWAHGDKPYGNQAHHILVCESFYDDKWDGKHLDIVLQSNYRINNPENIIYLPQCPEGDNSSCHYHNLPDHAHGHDRYNNKILRRVKKVYDKVNEALAEKDCDKKKDILKAIYDMLKDIEADFFSYILDRGPKPIG